MGHIVLLGDSIFDNRVYVAGGPAVIDQVQACVPAGWRASLLAVDGDTTVEARARVAGVPQDSSHLVLSVGGNDALGCLNQMQQSTKTVMEGLQHLHRMQADFAQKYTALLDDLKALKKPLMVCTVYDAVPGLSEPLKTALSMFNDVILRNAFARGLPVLDLRLICSDFADYSKLSPIEPSSAGGEKIARGIVAAMTRHDFSQSYCQIYI